MNDSANQVDKKTSAGVPPPSEQTVEPQCSPDDCGPGGAAVKSVQKHFCCRDGTLPGAAQQLSAEDQTLLRRRLLAISALALVGHGLNFFQGLFVGEPYLLQLTIPLVILTAGVVILASQLSLSYRRLRAIEVAIFGTAVLYFACINYLLTLHSAQQGDEVMTAIGLDRTVTSFFALMICYGLFIPNTWRRALAVVLPMAVTPVLLALYFIFGNTAATPILRENASPEYISYLILVLLFGAFASVFGTHIIHKADPGRFHDGNTRIHGPRDCPEEPTDRRTQRYLFVGLRGLLVAHRPPGVRKQKRDGNDRRSRQDTPGTAIRTNRDTGSRGS